MADDGDDTTDARARLERVAWGAGSTEAEAAKARIALADLDRRAQRRSSAVRREPAAAEAAPAPAAAPLPEPAPMPRPDPVPERRPTDQGEPSLQAETDGTAEPDRPEGADDDATRPSSVWGRVRRVFAGRRARPWIAGGVAAAVVVAFGTGLVVGTARPDMPASPSVTPSAGTVTLEQLLDAPQTYADQLPGSFEVPVSLHTTRLVFTNRSLSGDDSATPWNVWAGVGSDRSTICLVATADRLQATTACYPREDALHGSVSLSASSLSGTLTVNLSGGGVQGLVTNEY
ncbi:hypothetical protein ACO0E1_09020 [Curtobacterium sp. RRHDQ66]|uniref:hypothetical protein n=1 Tax=Curtobacterium guangdongense TaxID=3413380 RepID=UPI003BF38583